MATVKVRVYSPNGIHFTTIAETEIPDADYKNPVEVAAALREAAYEIEHGDGARKLQDWQA